MSAPGGYSARIVTDIAAGATVLFARLLTAVRGVWQGGEPGEGQRVLFANHSSHGDFVLVWTVLPPRLRRRTRPVAAADYWLASPLRRFVGRDVFRALLIERPRRGPGAGAAEPGERRERGAGEADASDPIGAMAAALDDGDSLILFPEGTRNVSEAPLQPFRSGLYRLAAMRPDIDLVPVWIDNLNRVLPKGEVVPIPLVCTVTFGAPLRLAPAETGKAFLARAEAALRALAPERHAADAAADATTDAATDHACEHTEDRS